MIMLPIIIPSSTRYGSECRSEPISLVGSLKEAKRNFVYFYAFCFGLLLCFLLAFEVLFKLVSSPGSPAPIMVIGWVASLAPLLLGEYRYYDDTLKFLCLHEPSSWMLNLDSKQRKHRYGVFLAMHWICVSEGTILFFLMRPKGASTLWDENYFLLSMLYIVVGVFVIMGLLFFGYDTFKVHRERQRWCARRATDPNFQMTFAEYAHAVESEDEKASAQKNRRHHRGQNH